MFEFLFYDNFDRNCDLNLAKVDHGSGLAPAWLHTRRGPHAVIVPPPPPAGPLTTWPQTLVRQRQNFAGVALSLSAGDEISNFKRTPFENQGN